MILKTKEWTACFHWNFSKASMITKHWISKPNEWTTRVHFTNSQHIWSFRKIDASQLVTTDILCGLSQLNRDTQALTEWVNQLI
jgi:hypothetical protein